MDDFKTHSTKRTHDTFLAHDQASRPESSQMHFTQRYTQSFATNQDPPSRKARKIAHLADVSPEVAGVSTSPEQVNIETPTKATTTPKDQQDRDMSDAFAEDHHVNEAPAKPVSVNTKSRSFVALPQILASDIANNRYAPTDPTALRHYLEEVQQRYLHPARTPIETPSSSVKEMERNAIFEKVFCNFTNAECIPTYNSLHRRAGSGAAISKQILQYAGTWFDEEKTVLPYKARKAADQQRLKVLGLGPEHFPTPHETKIAAMKPATKRKAISTPNKQKAAEMSTQDTPNNGVVEGVEPASDSTTASQSPEHILPSQASEPQQALVCDASESAEVYDEVHTEEVDFVKGHFNPSLHEVVQAATATFAAESSHTISFVVDDQSYVVNKDAVYEHCGFVRERLPDGDENRSLSLDGRSPVIVRAFLQAIFPGSNKLPVYSIDFPGTEACFERADSDPLGVLEGIDTHARKIDWNIRACRMLYDLASAMDCSLVKDMVTDQILELWNEECRQDGDSIKDSKEMKLPYELLNGLSLTEDGPLIRLIGHIHIHRGPSMWPKVLSETVVEAIERWREGADVPQPWTSHGHCERFHTHGNDKPCYRDAAQAPKADTEIMISELFDDPRENAYEANATALSDAQFEKPLDREESETRYWEANLVQWSLKQGQQAVDALLNIEEHEQELLSPTAPEEDKKVWRQSLDNWKQDLVDLREEYWWMWNLFENRWVMGYNINGEVHGPNRFFSTLGKTALVEEEKPGDWTLEGKVGIGLDEDYL
ncbi:hypothetical protein CC86DRAFT_439179 [Ophiobolus disseminans]|uniref:Uncharacterized protein n=1 Tax=Ophiobolus disseminans TaxID=1469910 RepID=A0A6A7A6A1_9PLEO|nr:hypothetical protein CC86DRAFT_439179 [Ophiobolus disseminans]